VFSAWQIIAGMAAIALCLLFFDRWYFSEERNRLRFEEYQREREKRTQAFVRDAAKNLGPHIVKADGEPESESRADEVGSG
jgi:hypothetical protein